MERKRCWRKNRKESWAYAQAQDKMTCVNASMPLCVAKKPVAWYWSTWRPKQQHPYALTSRENGNGVKAKKKKKVKQKKERARTSNKNDAKRDRDRCPRGQRCPISIARAVFFGSREARAWNVRMLVQWRMYDGQDARIEYASSKSGRKITDSVTHRDDGVKERIPYRPCNEKEKEKRSRKKMLWKKTRKMGQIDKWKAWSMCRPFVTESVESDWAQIAHGSCRVFDKFDTEQPKRTAKNNNNDMSWRARTMRRSTRKMRKRAQIESRRQHIGTLKISLSRLSRICMDNDDDNDTYRPSRVEGGTVCRWRWRNGADWESTCDVRRIGEERRSAQKERRGAHGRTENGKTLNPSRAVTRHEL